MAATGIFVTPSFANAPVPNPAPPVSGTLTPAEEAELESSATHPASVYYQGALVPDNVDIPDAAQVCAEVGVDATMHCFDTDAQANAYLAQHAPTQAAREGAAQAAAGAGNVGTNAYSDCPSTWVCLWEHADFTGRRLQWPTYDTAKTRHLDRYKPSFRDKTSSAFVNRPQRGVWLYDIRSGLPDPHLILASGWSLYSNFKDYDYPYGGNWNDKADAIKF
ncbi:peptidase inhibitor family I36 protein [Streptomyces sp. NPDC005955]|uniref:peptidase inhibitor family I36 protein n=1 Tax=Streptomyces sp. NPDC005955 TaxID=3364738 RepID=UPI0036CB6D58